MVQFKSYVLVAYNFFWAKVSLRRALPSRPKCTFKEADHIIVGTVGAGIGDLETEVEIYQLNLSAAVYDDIVCANIMVVVRLQP